MCYNFKESSAMWGDFHMCHWLEDCYLWYFRRGLCLSIQPTAKLKSLLSPLWLLFSFSPNALLHRLQLAWNTAMRALNQISPSLKPTFPLSCWQLSNTLISRLACPPLYLGGAWGTADATQLVILTKEHFWADGSFHHPRRAFSVNMFKSRLTDFFFYELNVVHCLTPLGKGICLFSLLKEHPHKA